MKSSASRTLILLIAITQSVACSSPSEVAAPSLDPLPDLTNENPLLILGSSEPQATIQIRGGVDAIGEGVSDSEGRFSVSVNLRPDSENNLLVSQVVDGVESPSAMVRVTHDGTAPAVPVVDGVVTPTRLTTQTVRGSTEAGAVVSITGAMAPAMGTADVAGRFEIEVELVSSASGPVDNDLRISAQDAAGNRSPSAEVTITFDPTLAVEAPVLDSVPSRVRESRLTLTGMAEAGVGIVVVGGATDGMTSVGADGRFSVSIGLRPNAENRLLVFAVSGTDTSPSVAVDVTHDDIAPGAPEVHPEASPTGAETVTLTGLSEAGATLRVAGGAVPSMATADIDGSFEVAVMLTLDASNELVVGAEDLAGNLSEATTLTIVQDSTLEAPITVDPVASPTATPAVRLSGGAAASIGIEITGGVSTVMTMSDGSGAWSADLTLRGNVRNELRVTRPGSGVDTIVVIEHDDIPPDPPMINPPASPTDSTTVVVSGTTEARARVSISGATSPAATTAGIDGRFSVGVIIAMDSETTLTAIATDRAGNSSSGTIARVVHSSAAVPAPIVDETNPPPTATPMYTVTGSVATPGPGITILVRGGAMDASGPIDPSTGRFSVSVTLNTNATNDLRVVSVEGAIESAPAAVSITHDDIAPAAPSASALSASSSTCVAGVPTGGNVAGSMGAVEARATVRIENVTGGRRATTSATDGGSFSVSIGACTGDVIRVTAIDAAANESAATEITAS